MMSRKPLHIAFCINDAYVPYLCVTIKSIMENNSLHAIYIHILTDFISEAQRLLLSNCVFDLKKLSLQVYFVDDTLLKGLRIGNLTLHTWYRLLLPEILPNDVSRVLYLDADTIVTDNLGELFELDMGNVAVAGSLDPQSFTDKPYERCGYEKNKQYICAGVLLINLDYWRENHLTDKIIKYAQANNERLIFQDQDAINYVCQDSKIILPFRYGTVLWFFYMNELYTESSYYKQLYDSFYHPAIIHYIGCHPWQKEISIRHIMYDEWLKYNNMLKHPVKRTYGVKLSIVIKSWIYRILYPSKNFKGMTLNDVESKLIAHNN